MLQGANETEDEGTSRAKSLLFKKKLADKDRVIKEKEEEIQMKEQNLVVKEKIIAEWEEVIQNLTSQLKDKTDLMEQYQQSREPMGDSTETEVEYVFIHQVEMSPLVGKPTLWFPTRSDTNRTAQ